MKYVLPIIVLLLSFITPSSAHAQAATPTFFCVGTTLQPPCATIPPSQTVTGSSPVPSITTIPSISQQPSTTTPSTTVSPIPCSTISSSVVSAFARKHHAPEPPGLLQQFIEFLLQLLQLLFQRLGIQLPMQTGPAPTPAPTTAPVEGQPTSISAEPTANPCVTQNPQPNVASQPAQGTQTTPTSTPTPAQGYYVAPNGSDSNPGTLQAPFATLSKCQSAMQGSSATKTCYIRAGTYRPTSTGTDCSGYSAALNLTSSDSGETWSYYPPDGYNTAIIDGGSTGASNGLSTAICLAHASGVTINGLQLQHFGFDIIQAIHSPNATITNNIVHDIYDNHYGGAIQLFGTSQGAHVTHNVIYNSASEGIQAQSCNGGYGGCSQGISNDVIAYNFIYNYCYDNYDCGAIYFQDYDTPRSTNVLAEYNYVRDGDLVGPDAPANDTGGIGGGRALYLDDGTSNATFKGNIVTGKNDMCGQFHGGSNDTFKNTICDLQPPPANQNVGSVTDVGPIIFFFQNSTDGNGMTNDHADNNIIISNDSDGGKGYIPASSPPTKLEISNNAYHNYAGGPTGSCYTGDIYICGSAGNDSSPQNISSLFNPCPTDGADSWSFELNSVSPALGSPVSFPQPANDRGVLWGRSGFWGPPGYHISHTGNAPSYNPC